MFLSCKTIFPNESVHINIHTVGMQSSLPLSIHTLWVIALEFWSFFLSLFFFFSIFVLLGFSC